MGFTTVHGAFRTRNATPAFPFSSPNEGRVRIPRKVRALNL
jgi:hypothetical protein